MTDNQSEMVFLQRLPEAIELQNGEENYNLLFLEFPRIWNS